jgi:hypothetical protein
MKRVAIKQRQLDTILAALRYWQYALLHDDCLEDELMIAEDHGTALTVEEVDELC